MNVAAPTRYIGRFAPSPTGPLHAGSLVAALASWLDARAHGGQWLVRMEDVDTTRCLSGMDQRILQQLAACGLHSDQPPVYQTRRSALYQQALAALAQRGLAYPCACSRKDIANTLSHQRQGKARHAELIYPGTCRNGLAGRVARAWRLRTDIYTENWPLARTNEGLSAIISIANRKPLSRISADLAALPTPPITWTDRRLGRQQQDVQAEVGDFILQRADGCFAYQLAVVVDDGAQGITDIVRGEDLADNTARQILLQRALGLPMPRYLHTPLVLGSDGDKLSKQNGATPIDTATDASALEAIRAAACALGLPVAASSTIQDNLHTLTVAWKDHHSRS